MPKVMMTVATPSPGCGRRLNWPRAGTSLGLRQLARLSRTVCQWPSGQPPAAQPRADGFSRAIILCDLRHHTVVAPGRNCVGLWLGALVCWRPRGSPHARAAAAISSGDDRRGKSVEIVSDETWKSGTSPYATLGRGQREGGERYDVRLEIRRGVRLITTITIGRASKLRRRPPPGPNRSCARRIGSVLPLPRWPVRIWEVVVTNWISVRIWPDGCG